MLNRALGAAGVLGGAALLAAFVVAIPPEANNARLVLFNVGAIAVVLAVYRQWAGSSRLARTVVGATVVANAWHLAMIVLSTGQSNPFAGDFGLAFFYAAIAMWLTDAAFGLTVLRYRGVPRWGAWVLAVGSVLAIAGMDRLGLTSAAEPTMFGRLGLIGVALNGLGWILLGLELAVQGRSQAAPGSVHLAS